MNVNDWTPPKTAIPLWSGAPPGFKAEYGQPAPTITPYLKKDNRLHGAVIVLPGGGYGRKAAHEAEPVARWLNHLGLSAFVLDYRVAPYRHPIPLLDARRAVQIVRSRAQEWKIDPARVGILGFSAGGHLAASAGTHFEEIEAGEPDGISRLSFRPSFLVLCYPVITFGNFRHHGSMENLLGPNPPDALRESLSCELRVTNQTPPSFLWHTANDATVPVENSLLFAGALAASRIPFELHIFADGEHGVGLAAGHPSAGPWTSLCAQWLRRVAFSAAAAG